MDFLNCVKEKENIETIKNEKTVKLLWVLIPSAQLGGEGGEASVQFSENWKKCPDFGEKKS